jgi:hypothetical protein
VESMKISLVYSHYNTLDLRTKFQELCLTRRIIVLFWS